MSWGDQKIRVNCVASGIQGSGAVASMLHLEQKEIVSDLVPLKRLARPEDCAAAVSDM